MSKVTLRRPEARAMAQLLAEQTDLSLAEIAYKCGFSDYNYFITVFKKLVGVPPIAYRQQIVKAE